ncbi:hypothetical protein H9L39_10114 [Fusarium oxysporum f. sp. albedinis]|nr:hypothetical protein H9L39_10114 [Fusarium oxysporum f. sp. albedinis]
MQLDVFGLAPVTGALDWALILYPHKTCFRQSDAVIVHEDMWFSANHVTVPEPGHPYWQSSSLEPQVVCSDHQASRSSVYYHPMISRESQVSQDHSPDRNNSGLWGAGQHLGFWFKNGLSHPCDDVVCYAASQSRLLQHRN